MPTYELRPEKDRQWNTKLHWAVWWFDIYILGVSPSVAAVPQDDRGVFRNISSPPSLSAILRAEMVSLKCSLHAKVAHSRHRVLPVPVGLSRTPFTFWNKQADMCNGFNFWESFCQLWCVFANWQLSTTDRKVIRCFTSSSWKRSETTLFKHSRSSCIVRTRV